MKRFVIGDVHGQIHALKDVLKKSKFNHEKDKLIVLGDVVDGGYNTYEVVEELLKIKHLIFVIGNHDVFLMDHIKSGWAEHIWINQGGANTLNSYGAKVIPGDRILDDFYLDTTNINIPVTHQDFFNRGMYWHEEDSMLFVHGGFDPFTKKGLDEQGSTKLTWDRNLINYARKHIIKQYRYVFVGHTATQTIRNYGGNKPLKLNNLWCVDTGAGWNGFLTIMDITDPDNVEYWQSDVQTPALDYKELQRRFACLQ